ncbi:MAG: FAD-binding oxidoreductase [Rhodobacteraceae bacterium]|jgi:FAD/FMN-containing dehydrogenase|nr:FAD-binding oxidoreductase [Paracoccaceae bacterium]
MTADDLLSRLAAAMGPRGLAVGAAIPARNAADAAGYPPRSPRAVAMPETTAEVAAVLRLCHAAGQPVVVQGGLTGLAGGAVPRPGEIALSLERLRGVEEVDTASATLTARAGTPLAEVQAAAEAAGLVCGIDLGARGSCTIGGNVATNAGGNQVVRYGMARRNVLGLEVVQPDGTVVTGLNKMMKNNAGYDWTQLYIGSEGTLGVITRVVLALHPRPRAVQTALCAVADTAGALALLSRLADRFGADLLVFEAMWREFLAVAVSRLERSPPFAAIPEVVVLVEVAMGGSADPAGDFAEALGGLMGEGLIADALLARSGADRARLWSYRESPYDYARLGLPAINFDVSVPRAGMAAAVAELRAAAQAGWPRSLTAMFGHLADSNLHVVVLQDPADGADAGAVEAAVYALVARHGGSISAEHGIGVIKRPWLALSRSAAELALMRRLKAALDPGDILNPGRVLG